MNLKNVQLYGNIQWKKINFAEEPFETNMRHHPPMVFASVYHTREKLSSGPAAQLLLEEKPVVGAAPFCSENCSFPGVVLAPHIPAWPQSWRVRLPCFLWRTVVLGIFLLASDSQSLLFYIQTLRFLFCTAKSCQLNTREFTLPLYKHFFNT